MDKLLRFLTGAILSFTVSTATGNTETGVRVTTAIGIQKEMYDYNHPREHSAEVLDSVATTCGGFTGAGLYLLIKRENENRMAHE